MNPTAKADENWPQFLKWLVVMIVFGLMPAQGHAMPPYLAATKKTDPLKFSFGEISETGWTHVAPTNFYSTANGFGFEPGLPRQSEATAGAEVDGADYVTSEKPFLFSVKLPEGNYAVTALLNDRTGESVTTVKSEQRRLMLEKIQIHPGTFAARTFIVNIRTAKISSTEKVHLKKREVETETVDWDEKLTLEFAGTHPTLRALVIAPTNVPTLFITGDSTVCDQPAEPWNSWGQMLPRFFKPEIAVANYAESGESIKSSLGAKRFDKVFSLMKSGDYLFVQFGHNDMKDKATNALAVYKSNLKKIVARTRALGGTPVLIASMERKAGVQSPTLMDYPQTVRDVAKSENCALIDLNAMSLKFYHALGTNLDKAFVDGTHHNNYGSYEFAQCVVEGIKQAKLPLAKFIVDDFNGFDPAKPDDVNTFEIPASLNVSKEKPLEN